MESFVQIVVVPILLAAAFFWPERLLFRVLTGGRFPPPGQAHDLELVAMVVVTGLLIVLAVHFH